MDQSMPVPVSTISRRRCSRRWMVLWALKSCGMVVMRRPTSFSVSMATPVLPRRASSSAKPMSDQRPSSQSALLGL